MPYKDKEVMYARQATHREKNFQEMWALLAASECMDCRLQDPRVLQFDHRPGVEKRFSIASAVGNSTRSWALIQTEIDKCDIVCANCHIIRTATRGRFKRFHASVA